MAEFTKEMLFFGWRFRHAVYERVRIFASSPSIHIPLQVYALPHVCVSRQHELGFPHPLFHTRLRAISFSLISTTFPTDSLICTGFSSLPPPQTVKSFALTYSVHIHSLSVNPIRLSFASLSLCLSAQATNSRRDSVLLYSLPLNASIPAPLSLFLGRLAFPSDRVSSSCYLFSQRF